MRWAIADGYTIARRNITHVRYVPERLINATVQPIMFVVLFSYVFGAAIAVPGGGNYRAFLMAGIFTQSLIFGFVTSAITMNDDMSKGVVDRFRSLPMARSAVLLGRTASDFVESLLAVGVMVVCGLFVGWRMENGIGSALAAFGLLLLLAYAMSWLGTWVGLIVRTPDAAAEHRLHRDLSVDVRGQCLRADGGHAGVDAGVRQLEPGQRDRAGVPPAVRQSGRQPADGVALAARRPGLGGVVAVDPRHLRAPRRAPLSIRRVALSARSFSPPPGG